MNVELGKVDFRGRALFTALAGIIGSLFGGVLCSSKTVQGAVSDAQLALAHQISDRFPKNHDAPRAVLNAAALALEKIAKNEARTFDVSSSMEDLRAAQAFTKKLTDWTKQWRGASDEYLESETVQTLLEGVSSALTTETPGEVSHAHIEAQRSAAIQAVRDVLVEKLDPPEAFLRRFDGKTEGRGFFSAFAEYIAVALKTNDNFRTIFETVQRQDIQLGIIELLGYERTRRREDEKDAGIEWIDDIQLVAGVSRNRPSGMVLAKHRITPFLDFDQRLNKLINWATSSIKPSANALRSVSGRLYVGDGGTGKTRLALELADKLDDRGWEVARISENADQNRIWRSLVGKTKPRGILIIIDYVEAKLEALKALAKEASKLSMSDGPPIRILVLSRSSQGWWDGMFSHDGVDIFERHPVNIGLSSTALSLDAREFLFEAAQGEFRPLLKSFALLEGESNAPALSTDEFRSPISVVFAAYLHARGVTLSEGVNLIEEMLNEERKAWSRYLKSVHADSNDMRLKSIERGIAQVTLFQGAGSSLTRQILSSDTNFGERTTAQVSQVTDDLAKFYPSDHQAADTIGAMEPDILGEAIIARVMSSDPSEILLEQTYLAFTTSEQFAEKIPANLQVLIRGAAQHPEKPTRDTFAILIARLSALIKNDALNSHAVSVIAAHLPEYSTSLLEFATAIQEKVLALSSSEAERAAALSDLGVRYSAVGDRKAALNAALEAVELYRHLAEKNPDAFNPYLAASLSNLGNRHSDLGHHEAALKAALEAVELYRELALKNPNAFSADLASSLNNLGNRHSDLGDHEAALKTTLEAVELYRQLAQKNPDAFNPNLAASLNNLGGRHSDLGEHEAALKAALEAVDLYRQLAQKNPDAFNPNLAASLSNLGIRHSALGDREAALKAALEAVELRRQLAQKNPDAFNPYLAKSLSALGDRFASMETWDEAKTAYFECDGLLRPYLEKFAEKFGQLWSLNLIDLVKACLGADQSDEEILHELSEYGLPSELTSDVLKAAKGEALDATDEDG